MAARQGDPYELSLQKRLPQIQARMRARQGGMQSLAGMRGRGAGIQTSAAPPSVPGMAGMSVPGNTAPPGAAELMVDVRDGEGNPYTRWQHNGQDYYTQRPVTPGPQTRLWDSRSPTMETFGQPLQSGVSPPDALSHVPGGSMAHGYRQPLPPMRSLDTVMNETPNLMQRTPFGQPHLTPQQRALVNAATQQYLNSDPPSGPPLARSGAPMIPATAGQDLGGAPTLTRDGTNYVDPANLPAGTIVNVQMPGGMQRQREYDLGTRGAPLRVMSNGDGTVRLLPRAGWVPPDAHLSPEEKRDRRMENRARQQERFDEQRQEGLDRLARRLEIAQMRRTGRLPASGMLAQRRQKPAWQGTLEQVAGIPAIDRANPENQPIIQNVALQALDQFIAGGDFSDAAIDRLRQQYTQIGIPPEKIEEWIGDNSTSWYRWWTSPHQDQRREVLDKILGRKPPEKIHHPDYQMWGP